MLILKVVFNLPAIVILTKRIVLLSGNIQGNVRKITSQSLACEYVLLTEPALWLLVTEEYGYTFNS